jgi:Protein of unknown function (DUF732)
MRLVLVLASVAVVIGAAAPASADTDSSDQVFLAALKEAGLTYQDPDRAIAVGHTVCRLVDGGMTGVEIVKHLQDLNPGFQGDGAAKFTAIAATTYCPKSLTSEVQGPGPKSGGP